MASKKSVFVLGFKTRSVITLLCRFEINCLSQKVFVTHSSVGNRVKARSGGS